MNQIKTAFPSLPQLLDLLESPSYSNTKKPIVCRAKPRTAATNSTPKTREKRTPQAGTTFRKTDSTFYSPTNTINNSFQYEPYCFSELKTIPRPLKKLYSSNQHEVLKKKIGELHEKYSSLYDEKSEETSPEKFQELYLSAEKMFNTSYSIKYMGLKNDQLGVISQRLPMNLSQDHQPQVTSKSLRQAIKISQNRPSTRFLRQNSSKDSSLAGWRNNQVEGNHIKGGGESLLLGKSVLNSPKMDKFLMSPSGGNKTFSEVSTDRNVEHSHDVTCDDLAEKADVPETKEVNTTGIFVENKDSILLGEKSPCLVTKYFLPKKLQPVKRKNHDIESSLIKERPEDRSRMWQKVPIVNQTKENTADFTRKVRSMSKVKNSLLRNISMEKTWMAKGVKDDLDELENSRTFELRNVMAKNTKYSYAKLLQTMQTKERPETALIENTQKREKILANRDEKRRLFLQESDEYNKDFGSNYIVKIQYPKENKMLHQFIKIRENAVP